MANQGIFARNGEDAAASAGENEITYYPSLLRGGGVTLPGGRSQLKADGTGIDEKHRGIVITPTKGFVIKTTATTTTKAKPGLTMQETKGTSSSSTSTKKIFINVCYHNAISKPVPQTKLDGEGKEIEGLSVPLSMGPLRTCDDKRGQECLVVDSIVHPSIERDIQEEDENKRDFVCQVMLQFLEQKYSPTATTNGTCAGGVGVGVALVHVSRKYKLPKLKYFGYIDTETGLIVRKESEHTTVCKQIVRDNGMRGGVGRGAEDNHHPGRGDSGRPLIEEIKTRESQSSSSSKKKKIKKKLNDEGESRSLMMNEKRNSRKKDLNSSPTSPPLEFRFSVQLSDGEEMTIDDYLQEIHRCRNEKKRSNETMLERLNHEVIPLTWAGATGGGASLPLPFDPPCLVVVNSGGAEMKNDDNDSDGVNHANVVRRVTEVIARAKAPTLVDVGVGVESLITLEMSAFAFTLSCSRQRHNDSADDRGQQPTASAAPFGDTKCTLPFCVNAQRASCTYTTMYHVNTNIRQDGMEEEEERGENKMQSRPVRGKHHASEVCIRVPISSHLTLEESDIGSQPWLLAKALSTNKGNTRSSGRGEKNDITEESTTTDGGRAASHDTKLLQKDNNEEMIALMKEDDPYQLKNPFVWKYQSSMMLEKKSTVSLEATKNKGTTCQKSTLPEDSFHEKDCMSRHVLQQQEEEYREKMERSMQERRERREKARECQHKNHSNDTTSSDTDSSMEYIDADDFKPGGKYCPNQETHKQRKKKDEDSHATIAPGIKNDEKYDEAHCVNITSHQTALKNAEQLLLDSHGAGGYDENCIEKSPPTRQSIFFQSNDYWYKLL